MEFINLYLLSTYLKKWSYSDNRITLNYSFSYESGYERSHIDMRIGSPVNMVNEFLNNVFHKAKGKVQEQKADQENMEFTNSNNIILVNESEIKRKLMVYLTKILKDFNQNKRSRGRTRMISIRSLDFYYNDFEFEPLDKSVKFYIHLNRGANKMDGDLWTNAVGDFKLALEIKSDDVLTNKYMAIALNKLGKYQYAIEHLKIYAEAENTPESLSALASAYIHLDDYKSAEKIYKNIEKQFPDSHLALFGRAQLAYKQGRGFKSVLDRIYKKEPEWLREKLKAEWEYRISGYGGDEGSMWNAATAARYLGFDRPFDLTRRAFNDEMPSYFDSDKGTIRFVKEELDNWVEIMNRYNVDGDVYVIHKELLLPAEKKKLAMLRKSRKKKSVKKETENNKETLAI